MSSKKYSFAYDAVVPKTVKALLMYSVRPYAKKWLLFFALTTTGVTAWYAVPYTISLLVNDLAQNAVVSSTTWWFVVAFAALRLIDEIFWRVGEIYVRSFKPQMVERIRASLFAGVLKRPHDFFVNSSSGRVGHWVNQTTDTINDGIDMTIWDLWPQVSGLAISAGFLLFAHWSLALLFTIWLIGLLIFTIKRGHRFGELVAEQSDETSKAAGMIVDSVSNSVSVRVYGGSEFEKRQLGVQQQRIIHKWRRSWIHNTVTNVVKGQSSNVANVIAIILLVVLYDRGQVQIGDIVLFVAYFQSASASLWDITWALDLHYRNYGKMQNALDGLNGDDERADADVLFQADKKVAEIRLSSVRFAYTDASKVDVLDGIDLTIGNGEKVGVVGHSGAGKSTLVNLLLGFYDPTEGTIFANGVDVTTRDPSYMRGLCSFVPQDTNLFNRTIRENVMYARPAASDKELTRALDLAKATDFVNELPDGVDTLIGERGVKLSGGQRQRIAIARAILKDSPFLILDEATSALDSVSEQAIQKALHELMKGRTALVIAHRLSTLRHLDNIVVLEKGHIAEQGTHEELVKHDGIYADLWKRQKDGFIAE